MLGFLSGYPVGAQLITQSWQDGRISTASAKRMLGFCNNAGPAFLFGMLTPFFDNNCIIWTLWGIHILSGLLVGCILPADEDGKCSIVECQSTSLVDSLRNAICIMASVCGWIVVFRLIIGFCSRWFLWLLPSEIQILFCGILELANGCILLQKISCSGMRFIIASVILSFGGLCVSMQTLSVTKKLGSGWYFPGKLLQTLFSILLSFCAQILLFTGDNRINIPINGLIFVAAAAMLGIYFISGKKYVAFQKKLLYNNIK